MSKEYIVPCSLSTFCAILQISKCRSDLPHYIKFTYTYYNYLTTFYLAPAISLTSPIHISSGSYLPSNTFLLIILVASALHM